MKQTKRKRRGLHGFKREGDQPGKRKEKERKKKEKKKKKKKRKIRKVNWVF
jgi:hypothetical protein